MSYVLLYALKRVATMPVYILTLWLLAKILDRLNRSKTNIPTAVDIVIILAIALLLVVAFRDLRDAYKISADVFEYSLHETGMR